MFKPFYESKLRITTESYHIILYTCLKENIPIQLS